MNMERAGRPTPQWREVKRFEADGVVVVVVMLEGSRRYSVRVGQPSVKDAKIITSFVHAEVKGGFQITMKPLAGPIHSLLLKAEEWIQTDAATRVYDEVDRRIEKETKSASQGKPAARVTGKTARKKERLAARKVAA